MTLACKYDIRSTFSIGQVATQFDPTILLSCDLSPENLTQAEFEIFRILRFKVKESPIILPDLLFQRLSNVFFPPHLPSLPGKASDVALFLLFLTNFEKETFGKREATTEPDLLVNSAIAASLLILFGTRLIDPTLVDTLMSFLPPYDAREALHLKDGFYRAPIIFDFLSSKYECLAAEYKRVLEIVIDHHN